MHARAKELRILYSVADELNAATNLGDALEGMLARVTELLRLRTGWIWLLDPETNRFYNAAAHNLPPYLRDPVNMTGSWCVCTQNFRDGRLAPQNVDVIECSRLASAVESKLAALTGGLRYHASVPLYFRGKPLGIMNLTGPKWRRLTRGELRLLSTIALQAGATIERARLADEGARLARSEERSRLAREIHDTLVQRLTAIALELESALKHLNGRGGRARKELNRALAVTRDGIAEARRSLLALRGAPPAAEPLPLALEALARDFTSRTGIQVRVQAARIELPAPVEAELLAIAKEALTNVAKHARATAAEVRLLASGRQAQLVIRDNGVGFTKAMARREDRRSRGDGFTSQGQGIIGMRERAQLAGGSLKIAGTRRRGTVVAARVPIERVRQ